MAGIRCNFTVDTSSFTRALGKYASLVQNTKSLTDIIREQMAFSIRAIIDLTPFETLAQGRQAVHKDLLNAIKPYGGKDGSFSKIENDGLRTRLQSYLRGEEYEKIKDVFSRLGSRGYYANFEMVDFDESYHHVAQDRRGRVERDHRVLTPQVQEWTAYLERLQGSVGRARGGWVQSAEAVGLEGLPQWVTRHRDGGAVHALIEPGRVTFTFINRSVFIPDYEDKIELALAGREKAMANDIRRMFAGAATHAGFGGR